MSNWAKIIVSKFTNGNKFITVEDQNGFLETEEVLQALTKKNFEVLRYEEVFQFRFEYESYRERNDEFELVIVYKLDEYGRNPLPYDVVEKSNNLQLTYGLLFPEFAASSLKDIDSSYYDMLLDIRGEGEFKEPLGQKKTDLLLLEAIFQLPCRYIRSETALLKAILKLHTEKLPLPKRLAEQFEEYFKKKKLFKDWSLKEMAASSESFWFYIQKVWEGIVTETIPLELKGPSVLDLSNSEVVALLCYAFSKGFLRPIANSKKRLINNLDKRLLEVGLLEPNKKYQLREEIEVLIKELNTVLKNLNSFNYQEWLDFSQKYSLLLSKVQSLKGATYQEFSTVCRKIQEEVDKSFYSWLSLHYDSLLQTISTVGPINVSSICRYLERQEAKKKALLVIDGLSYAEWLYIQNSLQDKGFGFEQNCCFAMIPTLTSISRQSIFSGMKPALFASSIETTSKEEQEWRNYWKNTGEYSNNNILYLKESGTDTADKALNKIYFNHKIVGIVLNVIDDSMHGAVQGLPELYKDIGLWVERGYLENLLIGLLNKGFEIFITADHGNKECVGKGKVSEGRLSETRGQRVRIYQNRSLTNSVIDKFGKDVAVWTSSSLPQNCVAVEMLVDGCFEQENKVIVSHGGLSVEEVIVPFIKVKKEKNEIRI